MKNNIKFFFLYSGLFISIFLTLFFTNAFAAQTISELQNQITERNGEIETLEKEISEYTKELEVIGGEKQTLQSEIHRLDISRQKLSTDISITQKKISATEDTLEKIGIEIENAESGISQSKDVIGETIQKIDEMESRSMVEIVLSTDNLSFIWRAIDELEQFQNGVKQNMRALITLKDTLENKKEERGVERKNLINYKSKIADQRYIVDLNKKEQNVLLTETKNKESNYEKLIAEKTRLKEEFERDLLELESELRITIDPDSLPPEGKGVLRWPLRSIKITQKFGDTNFAKSGAYNGKGHNGVDFRASMGTEVFSAGRGKVVGIGNTDSIYGCYSYGKWIMIEHGNGISTLYAHLSLIKVNNGQNIEAGDIIGYSGNTGYSTGPHLHFSVYATQGVKIVRLGDIKSKTNCANARIPVAPFNAYLNPLLYL